MTPSTTPVTLFKIGNIEIHGDRILAPMDGYSDHPYRKIVRQMGSALVYSEFINAMDVLNGHPYLEQRIFFEEIERPIGFQLYDNDSERILKAAQVLRERGPDFIDINMGCAEKSVSGRGAGSGLLRDIEKIVRIFDQLSCKINIPITGKIRIGWDSETLNYLDVSRAIEENGGKMIAVHARTRKQYFEGRANWNAIAEVKKSVSIPVLGNGDISSQTDIDSMKTTTGCDGVLIGRAAIGNPWIFVQNRDVGVSRQEIKEMIYMHISEMIQFYGEQRGISRFRKHLTRYFLRTDPIQNEIRKQLLICTNLMDFLKALDQWLN
jgi:tRNA-dihydrouridine synthase B